jgi:hypothetical protein
VPATHWPRSAQHAQRTRTQPSTDGNRTGITRSAHSIKPAVRGRGRCAPAPTALGCLRRRQVGACGACDSQHERKHWDRLGAQSNTHRHTSTQHIRTPNPKTSTAARARACRHVHMPALYPPQAPRHALAHAHLALSRSPECAATCSGVSPSRFFALASSPAANSAAVKLAFHALNACCSSARL